MTAEVRPDLRKDDLVDLHAADAAVHSDPQLAAIWERATDHLAGVVANACTLLNPGVLLLGGGIVENLPNYKSMLLAKITPLIVDPARDDLDIRFGVLEEAAVLGAALLAAGR